MKIRAYNELISSLKEKYNSIYAYGIIDEQTGHFIYELFKNTNRPVFVLCENEKKARDLYSFFLNNNLKVNFFPDLIENYQVIEDMDFTNKSFRMKTLVSLVENTPSVVISTISSLLRKLKDSGKFKSSSIEISTSSEIDIDDFTKRLVTLGYQRRSIIEAKGEFAIRGDIIDIFQVHEDFPTRIELFDIEVDSIRKFDINTQISRNNIDNITIYPNLENFLIDENTSEIIGKISQDLEFSKSKLKSDRIERLETKFSRLIDEVKYGNISNMDLVIPYMSDDGVSILDYLPKDTIILFDDITNCQNMIEKIQSFRAVDLSERLENGDLLSSHLKIFNDYAKEATKFQYFQKINISGILKSLRDFKIDKLIEFRVRQNQNYHGQLYDFYADIKDMISKNYKNIIFAPTVEDSNDLSLKLFENHIDNEITDFSFNFIKNVGIVVGEIAQGFEYFEDGVNFISYSQIFKKKKKKKSKTIKNKDIVNYSDLEPGDLLVHDTYGIGKYIGIKNIELNNLKMDFIELHYKDGDKLFVPTSDMEMVSKFVGQGDKIPSLSNLKGSEWRKAKIKAKRAIEEIAEDLVELYAKRSQVEGFAFQKDTPWQKEFEDNFMYQETDAQLRAIEEIKMDMESNKVMDRLLCGDVGYGKTEVALRAAFKAIMDGKQVVMLAPTTILVKQHFDTMRARFKDFPIKIDYLSRFKTPSQKEKTIKGIEKGQIDFVVGTHALISKDLNFKNLGLLIIDEEQRFGVRHKEKIKEFSENIDVLTLSATPIPRTMQMSLSGIRDMSLLDEHPENRLPINTFVLEYDEIQIREAILKELARGGQVYFVYNRVSSINRMYQRLVELVPEARIAISHGQMSTRDLENILDDFTEKRFDVLLTTTIIETGMDIQNVNTIIVYNADMMGLSQLYQLKGRIGRSDRNSFAFFTYKSNKVLTDIAEKRLKAIKDFNELGSGYKIAMRDLELRGAGNLLGESQSGHIESIGYDLYVRMLKETIDEIKGIKPKKIDKTVKIDLNLDVFIPSSYISDENEKINIYKKISYIENEKDHYSIIDELTDRFGDIPQSVQNIIDISYIKSMLLYNDFEEMIELDKDIQIKYTNLEIFDFEKLKILSEKFKGEMKFNLIGSPSIFIPNKKGYTLKLIDLLEIITKINKGEFNEEN